MTAPMVHEVRRPAVAGSFYPASPVALRELVRRQVATADLEYPVPTSLRVDHLVGLLVPHAGLDYSGVVAAAGWRLAGAAPASGPANSADGSTVVILGTNHRAAWLDGIAIPDDAAWRTPLGDVPVDLDLAAEIAALGRPFLVDGEAHAGEHSIEVQLPFLQIVAPELSILPLAIATGTGHAAREAGDRLGELLAARRRAGRSILLAISSDMAHYPSARVAARVTQELVPAMRALDPLVLDRREADIRDSGLAGLACGMCGIEPAVVGLAALRATGATHGVALAAATSAEAGGGSARTVGYLSMAFTSDRTASGRLPEAAD